MVSMIVLFLSLLMYCVSVFANQLVSNLNFSFDSPSFSKEMLKLVSIFYVFLGIAAAWKINSELNSFEMYFVSPGEIGIVYGELNLFRYYVLLFAFPIGVYFLASNEENFFTRIFLLILVIMFGVLLWFTTRREQLILNFLFLFFYFNRFEFKISYIKIVIMAVFIISFTYFQLLLRGVQFSQGILSMEDFSLVSLGGYFIELWYYSPFYLDTDVSYFLGIFDGLSTLSVNMQFQKYLGGSWNNPTAGVFALFLISGFFPALFIYFLYTFSIDFCLKGSKGKRGYFYSMLAVFLMLRFLLFIRNGELFNALLDNFFFLIILSPYYFYEKD